MTALARALVALPILLLTPFILRALSFADPSVSTLLESIRATPAFQLGDQTFSPRSSLLGVVRVPVLDDILTTTTAAFSLVHIFPESNGAYWQCLVFLTEFAGVYALLLLEACRGVNKGRLFGYPLLLTLVGQMIPIGFVAPIWLFFYLVFTPSARYQVPGSIGIKPAHAAAVLPTVVLSYYIPHFLAFFHDDLNTRHLWMWVWQAYPILGSLAFFVLSQALAPVVNGWSSRKIVQVTLVILSMVNAGVNFYTDFNADFSAYDLFVPKYLVKGPQDPGVAMMTILQYDHVCTFAAVILWLLYSLGGSTSNSKGRMFGVLLFLGLLSVFGVVSVGTVALIAWELRERMMVAELEAVILQAAGGNKKKR